MYKEGVVSYQKQNYQLSESLLHKEAHRIGLEQIFTEKAFYCRSLVEVEAPGSRVNTYRNPTEVVLETEAEDGNYVFAIASYATLQKDMGSEDSTGRALRGYGSSAEAKRSVVEELLGEEFRYMISPVKMAEDSRSQRISTILLYYGDHIQRQLYAAVRRTAVQHRRRLQNVGCTVLVAQFILLLCRIDLVGLHRAGGSFCKAYERTGSRRVKKGSRTAMGQQGDSGSGDHMVQRTGRDPGGIADGIPGTVHLQTGLERADGSIPENSQKDVTASIPLQLSLPQSGRQGRTLFRTVWICQSYFLHDSEDRLLDVAAGRNEK